MTSKQQVRLAFIQIGPRSSLGYLDRFRTLFPEDVVLDVTTLAQEGETFNPFFQGQADLYFERVVGLVRKNHWDGIMLPVGPIQAYNPGLVDRIREAITIPVASSLDSSGEALRAFGVRRALLVSPYSEELNRMIQEFRVMQGIEEVHPTPAFGRSAIHSENVAMAVKLSPDDLYEMGIKGLRGVENIQAIHFQGGRLDPLMGAPKTVLERLETDCGVPVVASNPAMAWHVLSILGKPHSFIRGGRLLVEWPALVSA
jgi:maleate cis-trans isomerase